jgi:hypothetical protein
MAKTLTPNPIMSPDDERFMAFEGLVQWTQAVISQAKRVATANAEMTSAIRTGNAAQRRAAVLASHTEYHFFVVAAYKVIEHRDWVLSHGLCKAIDFQEIDRFSRGEIRDLRNMREHVVDYFRGIGHEPDRWMKETPEYKADASSIIDNMIGGRLNWVDFTAAAARLLPILLAMPIPYPPR